MEIQQSLQQFGLEGREARVYLAALKLGQARVSEIAEASSYERTYCYAILKNLEKEGLINKIEPKGKVATFVVESPKRLEELAKKRLQEIKNIMPQMKMMFARDELQPVVKFYRGKEGIKEIYGEATTSKSKKAYGIINLTAAYEVMGNALDKSLIQGAKAGVNMRDLIVVGKRSEEYLRKKKKYKWQETRYLAKNAYFETDFLIWDDKVALISFRDPLYGYLIKSQAIAEAWKQIHKVLWDLSK